MKTKFGKAKDFVFNCVVFSAVMVGGLVLDLVTKHCFEGMSKSLLGDFLWINSVHNTGAAFSMLDGARWLFVVLGVVAVLLICLVVFSNMFEMNRLFVVSVCLMASGIVGNLVDRIAFGYVRDFIDFRSTGFAVFNFADSLLCIGCALAVLSIILFYASSKKKAAEEEIGAKETLDGNGQSEVVKGENSQSESGTSEETGLNDEAKDGKGEETGLEDESKDGKEGK